MVIFPKHQPKRRVAFLEFASCHSVFMPLVLSNSDQAKINNILEHFRAVVLNLFLEKFIQYNLLLF